MAIYFRQAIMRVIDQLLNITLATLGAFNDELSDPRFHREMCRKMGQAQRSAYALNSV